MITLRYHEGEWHLDKSGCVVLCFGDRLPLCTESRPRLLCRPIARKGEAEWMIYPVVYQTDGSFTYIKNAEFILLTHSPASANRVFESLFA